MRIDFVINGFVDVQVGFRVRLNGTEFVVLQVSLHYFPPYHKYEIHVGSLADYRHVDCQTVAVDINSDNRIMNWRTSGFSPFDFEGMRGAERTPEPDTDICGPRSVSASFDIPLTPEVRAYYEHVFGPGTDRDQRIRAEVEAMEWPEVIGE